MIPAAKQSRLDQALAEQSLDAVALNAGPSLTYLTGLHFHLMERPIVLLYCRGYEPLLILPELESAKLDHLNGSFEAVTYPESPARWPDIFGRAIASRPLKQLRIGIEPQQLRLLEYRYLRTALPESSFHDGAAALFRLRSCKDETELSCMEKAVQICEAALQATLAQVRIGISEYDLAAELTIQLLRHGATADLPFSPIVAAGPNSANPHARPSRRHLTAGDLLVIDWGARWQDYTADLTRTYAIGPVGKTEHAIYDLVRRANQAARHIAGPAVACSTVDHAARSIIEAGGYGTCFHHRTGHGIGLECHEPPYIRADNDELLQPGMTFTIEPGIYLNGRNGVRIEDDVVITTDGCRSLSLLSTELQIIA